MSPKIGYASFNNISVISWQSVLLEEETRVPGENHRPATSHWQTVWMLLLFNVKRRRMNVNLYRYIYWVRDCCLTPSPKFFTCIMTQICYVLNMCTDWKYGIPWNCAIDRLLWKESFNSDINNSTNINKTNSHLSSQLIEKDHDVWCWKFRSWLETGTMWQGLTWDLNLPLLIIGSSYHLLVCADVSYEPLVRKKTFIFSSDISWSA
jgi:hypothetical protein